MEKSYTMKLKPQIGSQPGTEIDVVSVTYDDQMRTISPASNLVDISTHVTSFSSPYEISADQSTQYGLVTFIVRFENENGEIVSTPDDPIAGNLYRIISEQDIEIVLTPGSNTTGPTITAGQHVSEINGAGSAGFAYLETSIDRAYSGTYTSTSSFLAWPQVNIKTSLSLRSVEVLDNPERFR